jgi:hypothetical protein
MMAAVVDNMRQQESTLLCCFEKRLAVYWVQKLDG